MRVTVVRVDEARDEITFAPHEPGGAWVAAPLAGNLDAPVAVGRVGELEVDGDSWWLLPDDACAARVKLRAEGPPDRVTFTCSGGGRDLLDLTGYGVPPELRNKAAGLGFWKLSPPGAVLGHFDHPDVAAWAAAEGRRRERERRSLEDRKARARERAEAQFRFVNPYTFVPLPERAPRRSTPAGHHTLAPGPDGRARFQGRITARLRARSPMLVRGVGSMAPVVDGVAMAPRRPDGTLVLPGSSLHGALRALHETLTGSCLRVFDPEFVPVYRDVASGERRVGWQLALVTAADGDGRPTELARCTETKWVALDHLAVAVEPVCTGQRFRLDEKGFHRDHDRDVHDGETPAVLDPDGPWIVLVTDDGARSQKVGTHLCAVGRLPAAAGGFAPTDTAWREFRQAAEGTKQFFAGAREERPVLKDEQERLRRGQTLDDVLGADTHRVFPGMGRWLKPREWLHPGQVVWTGPVTGHYVTGLALSYLWRSAGSGVAGARIADGFSACHDPGDLCPSCRVFGMADTRETSASGVDRRLAEQRSYRGHVRVLDAARCDGGPPAVVALPAMGAPRPGSGQFYLDDPDGRPGANLHPRNRWGEGPDATSPRRLRGRKFYWHSDPGVDQERGRWRRHGHAPGTDQAEIVPAGSAWDIDLVVDGLTAAEIGGLVAALQPQRLFATLAEPLPYSAEADPEFAVHVGGGKPIGLGSCRVEDLAVRLEDARSRYLGGAPPGPVDPDELVAEFAADHTGVLEPTWQRLAAALHTAHVHAPILGYPTVEKWAGAEGHCGGKGSHEAFRWFTGTVGETMRAGRDKPFVALPAVEDVVTSLGVDDGVGR